MQNHSPREPSDADASLETVEFSVPNPTSAHRSPFAEGLENPIGSSKSPALEAIGRYPIFGELGRGGQASVYRGIHPNLPIEVAIKITHDKVGHQLQASLRQEALALCELDHQNIARIRDFDFDGDRPFMVLDLVRGRSLAQVSESNQLKPADAASLLSKLARAIHYAHTQGIIHRDLKPQNVVIDQKGEPKIIDFGLSLIRTAFHGDETNRFELSGTLAFMAPEQAKGDLSKTDHRVDIFSLGAILYSLVVGHSPYQGCSANRLIKTVQEGQWDRESLEKAKAPDQLKSICKRAMASDLGQRYSDASLMAQALDDVTKTVESRSANLLRILIASCLLILAAVIGISILMDKRKSSAYESSAVAENAGLHQGKLASSSDDIIRRFSITHIGNSSNQAEFSGTLMEYRSPRENDDIQVFAEFTHPAYCYLIAMNPNGVKQLCYPSRVDLAQSSPIQELRYPESESSAFGLTDGPGQQAFIVYASKDPLPPFEQWDGPLTSFDVPKSDISGNWVYQQGELTTLTTKHPMTRGQVRETKIPTPFKELCDRLRANKSSDVSAVLFVVAPSP